MLFRSLGSHRKGIEGLRNWVKSCRGLTIPPNMNWKRFKNGLRDLSEEEEEIAEVEREEDEEEIAFGSTFRVVIRWCLGQRLGGDGVGIGVVFGWLNEIGVCSQWVWVCRYGSGILLAVGLLPWVWVLLVVGVFFFFLVVGFAHSHALQWWWCRQWVMVGVCVCSGC